MNLNATEPVLLRSALQAGIALAVSFGLELSAEQVGAITALAAAVIGLWTRSKVSPAG
jgi:hypothetical protein